MPFILLLALIPFIEIYTFIEVGGEIGAGKTIALCILTAFIGIILIKIQGVQALMGAQSSLRAGLMPIEELFSGFCLIIAAIFLLIPGFVTDFMGFLLLIPPFRAFLRQNLTKFDHFSEIKRKNRPYRTQDDDIIEGQYKDVSKDHDRLEK